MKFEIQHLEKISSIEKSCKIIGPNNFKLAVFSISNDFINRLKNAVDFLNGIKKDLNRKEKDLVNDIKTLMYFERNKES